MHKKSDDAIDRSLKNVRNVEFKLVKVNCHISVDMNHKKTSPGSNMKLDCASITELLNETIARRGRRDVTQEMY